ncbi:MAG: hypothetical protein ABI304_14390 [Rudaea sp.]
MPGETRFAIVRVDHVHSSHGAREMKIYWIKTQAPLQVLALAKHLGIDAQFE